ncbi:MAG: hypothetical protein FWG79_08325 [Bacteroidales bacterium]|nr:hypothetical protein [Bacteroidales bacterium]
MKRITLILILIAAFATKSFAHCPIPQWCPDAPLHQTLCSGQQIEEIVFPSVIAKTLIITWWTNETRIHSFEDPPPGITVSGTSTPTPLGEREYAWPVSIKGAPTGIGTHHYTVSNTCGVELLHGSITLAPPTPATPGTIAFSPTSVCPGDAFTASIAAVSGATSYNWTVPGSMTHDGSDGTTINITNAGTTSGSLAISVTATNACGTSSPSTANITIGTTPNTPGTIAFSPTTACTGGSFTASISAVSGATSYNWTTPSNMTDNGSNSTSLGVTNAGITTGNFEVSVTAIGACGASEARTQTITVNASPAIGALAPTEDRATPQNTPFNPALTLTPAPTGDIQWYSNTTASNSGGASISGATGNSFAPPVTTINTTGVYYYAVATNSCGTATSNVSGRHTVVTPPPTCTPWVGANGCNDAALTFTLGTPTFVTNTTWPISGNGITQVWSDAVIAPGCEKGTIANNNAYASNAAVADCRQAREPNVGFLGHYFSWCMVVRFADQLCPDDWRVPTCQDFINLDIALGGNGTNRTTTVNGVTIANQVAWYTAASGGGGGASAIHTGGTWGGSRFTARASGLTNANSYYWSSSQSSGTDAFTLYLTASYVGPQSNNSKNYGFALRCVR